RTFDDATTCQVSQTNKCPITDDKAPLWRSLFAYWSARSSEDLLLIGICIPMCALLILLLDMQEQFEEQESKAVPGWLHFSNGNILDIVVKYSLKL
ncbi:hypothetical protein T4B_83, partial [Trichinella pseudospiralis]